ncbi:MAG TPA: beta-galactosidase domain 4-containing protein [Puia sp.]|uniref:beta-galactosidase domain 4-containing protein n=1 Tax=Puia sp. TaxID=2045100 RepID=UPI002CA30EC9|nr:beta-galactosidase domain 4-containing protein [Puia sp.]HVU97058.1 beta-galactosidase domain 4-containing protein [Puia sp.]
MKILIFCLLSYCCGMPFFASGQPIRTALAPTYGNLRITNDSLLKNYTNITLHWQFLVNGLVRQQGSAPGLTLLPGHSRTLRLPLKPPAPGEESYIKVEYRKPLRNSPPLATQTLPLTPWGGDTRIPATGELSFTDSNNVFSIGSPTLQLSFDKESGWLLQYTVKGQTLLADSNGLRPALPAPPHLQLFSTSTGSQMVIVRTEYTVPDLSCLLHLSYMVNSNGALLVESTLETDTTRQDSILHPIDRFGVNWTLPTGADSLTWFGATDSIPAIHKATAPTAVPADNVRWCDIYDSTGKGLRLTADSNFLQLHISSLRTHIDIDSHLPSHPALPIHFHYSFKVTPLLTETPHQPAKPI